MRFLAEACLLGLLATSGSKALASPPESSSPEMPSAEPAAVSPAVSISRAAVRAAAAALRHDPNLGSEQTVRSLHWIDAKAAPPPVPSPPWVVGLFQFLGKAGSLILWIAGGIGLATAVVFALRLLGTRATRVRDPKLTVISHVGEFDIRPSSLPDDVGAAARDLLDAGRTRAALSLLYRGALSRAIHGFGVRIAESFTEGEALQAVETHLDASRTEYFGELVRLWQHAVYAGQSAPASSVALLCERFAPLLGPGTA